MIFQSVLAKFGGALIVLALFATLAVAQPPSETAVGVVFVDSNGNEKLDPGERRLEGIRVSNGKEIVVTDKQGKYQLPVSHDAVIFVIKPKGYRTPIDQERQLPRFYYLHKPLGSPKTLYPGVRPTGDLPSSINFPLYPQKEPGQFKAIMFGDPQPRNQTEVDYVAHDVVEELIGTDASFGVTLGDVMFDNLSLFDNQSKAIALAGIPWYNVIGNHDLNLEAKTRQHVNETFERVFGPTYYSFDYGEVHFMVIDNIDWYIPEESERGKYRAGIGERQLAFLKKDLELIPEDQLVVLMMHVPLIGVGDRQELYRLIEKRPFCMSISGHTHHHEHRFITKEDGWQGAEPHHHIINVTVSGSWWSGQKDENGIPHSMMACGAPNGYSILSFDGHQYQLDFKAARKEAGYQMRIDLPEQVAVDDLGQTTVWANVFNGSQKSKTEMRIDRGDWAEMKRTEVADPVYQRLVDFQNATPKPDFRKLTGPKKSPHLWALALSQDIEPGVHLVSVRTTDMNGKTFEDRRIFRVVGK